VITNVTCRYLSKEDVLADLAVLATQYNVPNGCYDESAADQMSEFDALKWLSLCEFLKTARRRK
jgi:hypothetical protein